MDRSVALTLLAVLVTGLSHSTKEGTFPPGWSISTKWRAVLLSTLGIVAGAIDLIANGATIGNALTTVLATSGAGLIVMVLEAIGGGGSGGSGGATIPIDVSAFARSERAPGPYGGAAMVALCAAMLVIPGCGFLQHPGPVLDDVIFDVQDAASILSTIRSVVEIFFMAHPAPGVQATVEKALADAELGLNAAVRATRGAKELSKEQLDAAWRDFRLAWSELEHILHDAGVVTGDGKFAVAREGREGEIRFPVPLAMGR